MNYYLQLFCPKEDIKRGVYAGNLKESKVLSDYFQYYQMFYGQEMMKVINILMEGD